MSSDSKKRKRRLGVDAQWCIENQATLSLKSFVEHFGYLDRQYSNARYKTIITKYLSSSDNLLVEYNGWNNSEECKLFWIMKQRKKNSLDAETGVTEYFGNVINQEAQLLNQPSTPPPNNNNNVFTRKSRQLNQPSTPLPNIEDAVQTEEDKNVYNLFNIYKKKAIQMASNDLFKIETNLHELLSHTNILLLSPDQYSETLLEVFSEETLNSLHSRLTNTFNNRFIEIDNNEELRVLNEVSKAIDAVEKNKIDRSEAELILLTLARGKEYHLAKAIKAINNLLQKLPTNSIKHINSLSETELFTTYIDPILVSIISDPERNTLLRWSNKKSEENDLRPDATITKLRQMKYQHNLGHGEVKVDDSCNHVLALDLLRIGLLTKDSLDFNKLENCLGFQVNGFNIVFYIMSLDFKKIYTLTEITRFKVPNSIHGLSAFLSQKNFHALVYICQIFWSNCIIASNEEVLIERFSPTVENLYRLIDASRSKYRECSLSFEA
ncbi:hypothetical protein BD770DRAFT_445279 [Pilaira anomala]|nr:hypothetical protein BD770DRAFT_445279 [Pilaira anomala]